MAQQLTKKFSSIVPEDFDQSFAYNKVFYSRLNDEPVTVHVKEFVSGQFTKYVNSDGSASFQKQMPTQSLKKSLTKLNV